MLLSPFCLSARLEISGVTSNFFAEHFTPSCTTAGGPSRTQRWMLFCLIDIIYLSFLKKFPLPWPTARSVFEPRLVSPLIIECRISYHPPNIFTIPDAWEGAGFCMFFLHLSLRFSSWRDGGGYTTWQRIVILVFFPSGGKNDMTSQVSTPVNVAAGVPDEGCFILHHTCTSRRVRSNIYDAFDVIARLCGRKFPSTRTQRGYASVAFVQRSMNQPGSHRRRPETGSSGGGPWQT